MKITLKGKLQLTRAGAVVSQHAFEREAFESASRNGPGLYVLKQPDIEIEVLAPSPARKPLARIADRVAGMNIGAKNYDDPAYQHQLARAALVVLGFYPGWRGDVNGSKVRPVLQALRAINPSIRLAQYTVLNEASDQIEGSASGDVARKLDVEGWWLRNTAGEKLRWSADYGAWDINFTAWARPDAQGLRYPQWRAQRDHAQIFGHLPELDAWYCDNVMHKPRTAPGNWRLDDVDLVNTDPALGVAYRRGHVDEWAAIRAQRSGVTIIGNADNDLSHPEWRGQLDMAFLEALIGKSYSREEWAGWRSAYDHYRATEGNLARGGRVIVNVHGQATDFGRARYGLATALLGDGMYCFTDAVAGYSSVPWFDEYDARLGAPTEPPPVASVAGVWSRLYQGGIVLVNPDKTASAAIKLPAGYRYIAGTQDRTTNSGAAAIDVQMPSRSGLILIKGG